MSESESSHSYDPDTAEIAMSLAAVILPLLLIIEKIKERPRGSQFSVPHKSSRFQPCLSYYMGAPDFLFSIA